LAAIGFGRYSRAGIGAARLAIGYQRVHHALLHGRRAQHDGRLAQFLLQLLRPGRLSLLLLSAVLVGVGFNVKVLVAFGVVPVFVLLYLAAARISWRQRIAHLAAAGAVLATVSLSWTGIYDLIPPQNRPFVDSTRDNSMLELVVGHNGIQRFVRRTRVLPSAAQVDAARTGGSTTVAARRPPDCHRHATMHRPDRCALPRRISRRRWVGSSRWR
jgi:hypothetical protein